MGRGTLEKVQDRSANPRGVLGRSRRFGTGRGIIGVVWDGLRGPSGRSRMGRRSLGKVRDGSGDPRGGPGWVDPGRVG